MTQKAPENNEGRGDVTNLYLNVQNISPADSEAHIWKP